MDKRILNQFIDACKVVDETTEAIRKLKSRSCVVSDVAKGSSHDFPYTLQTYRMEGLAYSAVKDPDELERMEQVLKERLQNAERIKQDVEAWLNTIPMRMQRIIRYRIFDELTWNDVAVRMGRRATAESVKKEYQRFMEMV